mgnify:CR=1 FL=1
MQECFAKECFAEECSAEEYSAEEWAAEKMVEEPQRGRAPTQGRHRRIPPWDRGGGTAPPPPSPGLTRN